MRNAITTDVVVLRWNGCIQILIKINNFRGELTDNSAKKEALCTSWVTPLDIKLIIRKTHFDDECIAGSFKQTAQLSNDSSIAGKSVSIA